MPSPIWEVSLDDSTMAPCPTIPQGLLHGYGVFTTFLATPGQPIFALDAHYARLKRDCEHFHLAWPWASFPQFEVLLSRFTTTQMTQPQVVRITMCADMMDPNQPKRPIEPRVFFSLRPWVAPPNPLQVCTVTFDRLFPQHKHINHLAEQVYLRQAWDQGYQDFLRISTTGYLTEAAYANVFLIQDETTLLTPSVEAAGCLPGILRAAVIAACQELGLSIEEGCYPPKIINTLQGIFLTNAAKGLYPVTKVNDITFDPKRIKPTLAAFKRHLPVQSMP